MMSTDFSSRSGVLREVSAQIAVGKNADKFFAGVENSNGARFGCSHGKDGFTDGLSGGNGGKVFLGTHDVTHGEKKGTSDGPLRGGVEHSLPVEPRA